MKLKTTWKRCLAGIAAGVVVAGLAGCGSGGDQNSAPQRADANAASGQLTGAGATFPYPIYSKWFDAYQKAHGVAINYQSIGSGGGIQQLKNGTVDFGASDAPLNAADEKAMPSPVVHIPTVAGAVAITYNVPGLTGLKLSGPTLADIYLGKVKRWSDLEIAKDNAGAKLPDTPIAVAHRSDGSGTTNIFTGYLAAVSREWSKQVGSGKSVNWPVGIGGKGSEGVAGTASKTPGAVGYVEMAYATQNKMPMASIQNKDGKFVTPSVASTTAAVKGGIAALQKDIKAPIVNQAGADAYPIAGVTYILAYQQQKDKAKGKLLTDFLKWAMTDGQGMAKDLDYAPLPSEVVKINDATMSSIQ